jgi:hypothetical protein
MALIFWQEPKRRIDWPMAALLVSLILVFGWALRHGHKEIAEITATLYIAAVFSAISKKYMQ